MKEIDPKVQRIINWRESMATLPDNLFFELMRVYLGEVQTPFNKTKLVEDLGSFLRKEDHQRTIVSLLSPLDRQLLAAIQAIPAATQEKMAAFFENTLAYADMYQQLLNLEERLLIYRSTDKKTGKTVININPMLENALAPFLSTATLLPQPVMEEENLSAPSTLTPELLAAYSCFLLADADVCKADGSFKKRIVHQLETIFPHGLSLLQQVTVAFINLQILKEDQNQIVLDRLRLQKFADLDPVNQYSLLCVACHGRFSRSGMAEQMQLLLNTAARLHREGLSRSSLLRLAFLIAEKNSDVPGLAPFGRSHRFSSILASSALSGDSLADSLPLQSASAPALLDRLLDTACDFGLLALRGRDVAGESVYVRGPVLEAAESASGASSLRAESGFGARSGSRGGGDFSARAAASASASGAAPAVSAFGTAPSRPFLTVDAGFSVTLLPGASLSQLLPLMSCMEVRQYDTAASFEITKKAVMRAFDTGLSAAEIGELLKKNALYELPQNLTVCMDDWYTAYRGASVFKGFILQVSAENIARVEKNRRIKDDLLRVLAPGIYLLNAETEEEARDIMKRSGLDFFGSIKGLEREKELLSFPQASYRREPAADDESPRTAESAAAAGTEPVAGAANNAATTSDAVASHLSRMQEALEGLAILPEQKEGLLERIQRKVVIDSAQLRGDSVRLERLEAGGMDYAGKLHIIDSAISSNSLVELVYESSSDPSGESCLVGLPLGVEKFEGDALLRIDLVPQHEEKKLSVGQARLVKRIRGSAFK